MGQANGQSAENSFAAPPRDKAELLDRIRTLLLARLQMLRRIGPAVLRSPAGQELVRQIDESLKRLKTDHIDLIQHHEILRFEDPHRIFDEKEGAQLAMLRSKGCRTGQGYFFSPPVGAEDLYPLLKRTRLTAA